MSTNMISVTNVGGLSKKTEKMYIHLKKQNEKLLLKLLMLIQTLSKQARKLLKH